ncbi:MAG: hypothetical protein KDE08_05230 [Rhodobacteraceae bacterium]|nr:hypothetical protein [Paracoccaceae bacterium]
MMTFRSVLWQRRHVGALVGILSALCMAGPDRASAACPTTADLDGGVRAVFANGGATDYRRLDSNLLEIFEPSGTRGTDGIVYTSQYGLYDLEAAEVFAGKRNQESRVILTYSEPVTNLPLPVSGKIWFGAITTSWPDGELVTDTAVYVFGNGDRRRINGCDYDVVPVKASFIAGQDWIMHDYIFIPSLPLAILTGRQFPGMANPEGRALARLEPISR